jgi:hypothetical protein
MTCESIQYEVSQAIDERRDLSAFEAHLSVCSDCSDFMAASVETGARYRTQVIQGIERLRRATPPARVRRSPAPGLIPLAAALLVLLSVPSRPAPSLPTVLAPSESGRVPLFDEVRFDPVDLQVLTWSGEPLLPSRLDQDLPSSISADVDSRIALPSSLRF